MNREIKKVKKEVQLMKTIWKASPPQHNELLCVCIGVSCVSLCISSSICRHIIALDVIKLSTYN